MSETLSSERDKESGREAVASRQQTSWLDRRISAFGKKLNDAAIGRATTTMIPANGGGAVPYGIVSARKPDVSAASR